MSIQQNVTQLTYTSPKQREKGLDKNGNTKVSLGVLERGKGVDWKSVENVTLFYFSLRYLVSWLNWAFFVCVGNDPGLNSMLSKWNAGELSIRRGNRISLGLPFSTTSQQELSAEILKAAPGQNTSVTSPTLSILPPHRVSCDADAGKLFF